MKEPVIKVRRLGKKYRIGLRRERYRTLRDVIGEWLSHQGMASGTADDEIWALRDVSFDVHEGEVLGIIGRNGAGKSTLLKILAQITYPTEGEVEIRGRVGSLLEVGTGFHPELTGRENIFLNGAILGMTRPEITRKFDQIVAFAEVDKFLDTPIKRYSSGMQMRLAFAVAAHLDPEILLVDEVLAVGDVAFQKKCLNKMDEVTTKGRTVLLVSHNLEAIQHLCRRALLIDRGAIVRIGDPEQVCDFYRQLVQGADGNRAFSYEGGNYKIRSVVIEGEGGILKTFAPAVITADVAFAKKCSDPHVHLFFRNADGTNIFGLGSGDLAGQTVVQASESFRFVFRIDEMPLLSGDYQLGVKVRSYDLGINEIVPVEFPFRVSQTPVYGTTPVSTRWHGNVGVRASVQILPSRDLKVQGA